MTTKRLCNVYRSTNVAEMYLYVDLREDLGRVPPSLLAEFGTPQLVTKLALSSSRKLARVDVNKVIESIEEKGFYLQMPPPREPYLLDLHRERPSNHDY